MNPRIFSLIAPGILLFATCVRAEDWTTRDGKTYQEVKVLEVKPDYVTILHHDGGGRVALADLPADLQKRFKYDPAKARAAAAATARADAANQRAIDSELTVAETGPLPKTTPGTGPVGTAVVSHQSTSDSSDIVLPDPIIGSDAPGPGHSSTSDMTASMQSLRHDFSDPTYHTAAHMVYEIDHQGLGPDKNDKNHHTIDEIANQ